MRWRERTQRWVETATATEKSANTIREKKGGGVKIRLDYMAQFVSVMASSSLYAAVSFDACDENLNRLS